MVRFDWQHVRGEGDRGKGLAGAGAGGGGEKVIRVYDK